MRVKYTMQQPVSARRSLAAGYYYAGFFLLSAFLATAVWAGARSVSPARVDIDNFGQINANYYRGSQPDAQGFAELKQLGIRTVIDLQKDGNPREPEWVRSDGMQYFNIPLSSRRPATEMQTEYFLKLGNDPQNMPIYVHCAGGRHRTGEMSAIYRLTHDGWTADQAYQEMKQYGFYSMWGHGSLKQYVYQYYSKLSAAGTKAEPVPLSVTLKK
jgi:protein tyrosine/serine phosphatase